MLLIFVCVRSDMMCVLVLCKKRDVTFHVILIAKLEKQFLQ